MRGRGAYRVRQGQRVDAGIHVTFCPVQDHRFGHVPSEWTTKSGGQGAVDLKSSAVGANFMELCD